MSTKTSNQPGRRTPLSLSGGITKGQPNNNKNGGNSANGHSSNAKQDNKNQQKTEQQQTNAQKQQTDTKENPLKVQNKQQTETKIPKPQPSQNAENSKTQKQQNQNDKKSLDKQQNGVTAASKTDNGNQQQNNKDKQQNGNDGNKINEKDKDKKLSVQEKPETDEKEKNKAQDKTEKDDKKSKEEKKESDLKKDAKKAKEDKKEDDVKKDQKSETDNKKENSDAQSEAKEKSDLSAKEQKDVVEVMEIAEEDPQQKPDAEKSAPATPKSTKENKKATPSKTPTQKTPTKAAEKTPQKSTPTIREVTTAIDDVEMEPLAVEQSPSKVHAVEAPVPSELVPTATSTPGKIVLPKRNIPAANTDVQLAMQSSTTPERPRVFSQISGRRAIRPITDYTPSKFQSNLQFRESYRRINTELDATNTSLNVTVGSEVPNNSSFSFFGRGRKRDRTPPQHSQSAIGELPTEMELSPPKRARLDFFSVVSSPLTLLRNRFSKANLQSSTPVKLQLKLDENEYDVEVQNVSGVSVHEDIDKPEDEKENTNEEDTTLGVEAAADNTPAEGELEIGDNGDKEILSKSDKQIFEDGDIKITETPLQFASGDTVAKNKRCVVM